MTTKVVRIEVILVNGIVRSDKSDDTVFDIVTYPDMALQSVHSMIVSTENLEDRADFIKYYDYFTEDNVPLDLTKSLTALGIQDGGRIIADIGRKRKRYLRGEDASAEGNSSGELLNLVCCTRIFAGEGVPLKEVRVLVRRRQLARYLMEDVASLWNKPNLKFRCGRITLVEDKTYEELGVEADGKIVVTGGRG